MGRDRNVRCSFVDLYRKGYKKKNYIIHKLLLEMSAVLLLIKQKTEKGCFFLSRAYYYMTIDFYCLENYTRCIVNI